MSVIGSNVLAGASGGAAAAGYEIERSLRFNSADSAYLSRTPSTAGNRKKFTISFWVKRTALDGGTGPGDHSALFSAGSWTSDSDLFNILFLGSGSGATLNIGFLNFGMSTNATFRDLSAWYHFVCAVDTDQAVLNDRIKLYQNGIDLDLAVSASVTQGLSTAVNNTVIQAIGKGSGSNFYYLNGYLADFHIIDGQQLDPSSFGEYDDNNVWQPIEYTFGTNPNNGTTWSNSVTSSTGSFYAGSGPSNLFNGSLGDGVDADTSDGSVTFTPASTITFSDKIRVYQVTSAVDFTLTDASNNTSTYSKAATSGGAWHTIATGGGTLKSLQCEPTASGYCNWRALEIDGFVLIDGTVDNSFKLDFSDNSSNAALGTDSSGNSNDWTVNNITAEGVDYSHALIASTGFTSSNPKTNAFNASVTDYAETNAGTNNQGSPGAYIELQKTFTNVTSLKVQYRPSGSGGVWAFRVTGTGITQTDVSGASVFALAPINLSSTTISDIRVSTLDNNNPSFLTAIEINGTRLIDEGSDVDSLVDSPTNGTQADTGVGGEVVGNYATFNPLNKGGATTISNGNLEFSTSATRTWYSTQGTIGVSSGKWYWEVLISGGSNYHCVGVGVPTKDMETGYGATEYGIWVYDARGRKVGEASSVSYGNSYGPGDIIGVALDSSAGTLAFYKNGVSQGTAFTTGLAGVTVLPQSGVYYDVTVNTHTINFGQRPFAYTAPSGFKALCTANLDDPTIADGSTAMDVALYTGNGSSQSITGLGFSPDFVWIKSRSQGLYHFLVDTVRGNTKTLSSNTTDNESFATETVINSFDSSGFTLNADDGLGYYGWNINSASLVAWTWDAGTSTVSNTDGSITSSVLANASAGFSIVSYTANGTAGATVGHGLNAQPYFMIGRLRGSDSDWAVYHNSVGNTGALVLNTTNATSTSSLWWNNTSPSNSTFTIGSIGALNTNGEAVIMYCFAPVEGYSAFGSYTGNGSSQFIYLGFRPKFWIHKRTDSSGSWMMVDSVRSSYNVAQDQLYANLSNAESQYGGSGILDFVSNGVVLRSTGADVNGSSVPYVYMAFGENPFSIARAR